ncbi:MAG TPA: thiamine phosphate synthase [Phycisphaerae bacterium]|nr:thiamine phosphate synthase [Phycisphaerae bacterium]
MNDTPDFAALRMIDANANRVREALRVMEDYARFALNDQQLSAELKLLRHELAEVLAFPALAQSILWRDTESDVGKVNKTDAEMRRGSLGNVVIAAGKRLSESLRVLEECVKTISIAAAQRLEQMRYRGYVVEQTLARIAGNSGARARFAQVRLYVLLTESLCHASMGWEKTLDAVLQAGAENPGKLCIQLREKNLPDGELLRRARILTVRCRQAGAVSIINDRPDIAILADADGIHVGQTDVPCAEARKLLGPEKIIGVSTEFLAQAQQGLRDGATYIAVGPMFATTTKEKKRIAGPAHAAEVRGALPEEVPMVAIGGITLENVGELRKAGCVAVCSAIISDRDPAKVTSEFLARVSSH